MPSLTPSELLLIALWVIFTLPWLFWRVLKTDYVAPLVVVQIASGILLGPGVLGAMAPAFQSALFTPEVIAGLQSIAMWAVVLFVFLAGVELDLGAAWVERRDTLVTALFALLTPFVFGMAAGEILWRHDPSWLGDNASHWQFVLGLGMACAITALPILVLFLNRLGILDQPLGQRVLRYASLDDIAIWGVLALILLDLPRLGRQALFAFSFAIAAPLIRRLFARLAEADRVPVALSWLLAVALYSDWAGLHYMVGAFLAGVVLDAHWFGRDAVERWRHQVLTLLMPVFFLSTGLRTSWDLGGFSVWIAALLLLFAAVAGKLLGVYIAGRLLNWPRGDALLIGWLLQTKALIMILFSNILLDRGVISSAMFTALLLMALLSTMLTIPMVTPVLKRR
jgi:Kef-type K+ transport system membrane component KefB